MKKNYFLQRLTVFMLLLFAFGLNAQQVIIETVQGSLEDAIKYRQNYAQPEYTKIADENGKNVYIANNSSHLFNLLKGENGIENINDYTLTINLGFDSATYNPPGIIFVYDENENMYPAFWEGSNTISVNLPEGTYDVFAEFTSLSVPYNSYIVIKELVNVSGNTNININVLEADNHIISSFYNEDSVPLEPGVLDPNTGTVVGGNSIVLFDRFLYFEPLERAPIGMQYIWNAKYSENEEPGWNFHVNDLSNRYSVVQSAIGIGNEGSNYFHIYPLLSDLSSSISQENSSEDWVMHIERFQPSVLGESGNNTIHRGFKTHIILNNISFSRKTVGMQFYDPEEGFVAFLSNPLSQNSANLLVYPAIMDYQVLNPPFPSRDFYINGNALFKGGEGEVLYGSGHIGFEANNISFAATTNGYQVLPFNPQFIFSALDNPQVVQGNNTPIAISGLAGNTIPIQYRGRYGEIRESDLFATEVEVKQNGNTVFSGSCDDFSWFSLPTSGQIEVLAINTNVLVDGLTGKNITTLSYDAFEADASPTLQHLQFRNTNDEEVTDRFVSASEGTVRLAAGDFQYNLEGGYFDYNGDNTVEFFYSLYDQEEWTELELTKYPEYFQMPAFGDYYEASLEDVIVPQDNTWFDVRIVCTDAAGNKQEQIISPAFKVEQATLEVEEVNPTAFSVYPNPVGDQLHVQLPQDVQGNFTFVITDLLGRTIHLEERQDNASFVWDSSTLPRGVYVVSIESGEKTMSKKVIRK